MKFREPASINDHTSIERNTRYNYVDADLLVEVLFREQGCLFQEAPSFDSSDSTGGYKNNVIIC